MSSHNIFFRSNKNDIMRIPSYLELSRIISKTGLFKYIEILQPKKENFQMKNSDIFRISSQNIYCGYPVEPLRRGSSNEYPQSMFLSRNKKNNV